MSVLEVLGLILGYVLFYIVCIILSNAATNYIEEKSAREKEQRKAEFEEWLKETKLKEEER